MSLAFPARLRTNALLCGSRDTTTLARAVAETAEIALRDKIAAGEITTLHDAVEAFRCMKDEIIASIGDQKED